MIFTFILGLFFVPVLLQIAKIFGLFVCVRECESQVYTLFGKVIGTLDTDRFEWLSLQTRVVTGVPV